MQACVLTSFINSNGPCQAEIFIKILTVEIAWILVENCMEIQFSYYTCNFHTMAAYSMEIVWIFSVTTEYSNTIQWKLRKNSYF